MVRVLISSSSTIVFNNSISLLFTSAIEYSGDTCDNCILSIVSLWDPSLLLSQPISIRELDASTEPATTGSTFLPAPTGTTVPADPNKSPLVIAVGIGFLILGPVCIGVFFYVNRRTATEVVDSEIWAGSLMSS
jgi:hypothetical protein